MTNTYCVKAMIEDSEEPSGFRAIWQFNAIIAKSKAQAISDCKWNMKRLAGTIPKFKWIAELEWEDNMAVN
jgi:endo-beta-N-acetylglucosaminidase D